MSPIMHHKVDDALLSTMKLHGTPHPTVPPQHHTEHHHYRKHKHKPARQNFFANPIKLGVYLGLGIYGLLQVLQQTVIIHHSDGDILEDGLWNLPNLLFGPQYNILAVMEASKKQFTNQDIMEQHQTQTERQARDMTVDELRPARMVKVEEEAAHKIDSAKAPDTEISSPDIGLDQSKDEILSDASIAATRTEGVSADGMNDEPSPPPSKLEATKEESKMVNPPSTTTSPKTIPGTTVNIEYARATPTKRQERPVDSKTPMATREDWQKVMREHPVYDTIPSTPLKVGLITADGIKGPTQHIFVDGIYGSDYLNLEVLCDVKVHNCTSALDYPNVDLWLVDANSAKSKPFPEDIVHQIVAIDNPSFRIFFVDYSDRLVLRKPFMDAVYFDIDEERLLAPHIRYALRCIDKYRRWAPAKGYINPGQAVHPLWDEMLITKGGPPLHAPFGVRTDIADTIHKLLPDMANLLTNGAPCSPYPYHPVDCIPDRPMDLIHLWKVIETNNGLLRNLATETVEKMGTWKHPVENRTLRVETAIQGNRAHAGRQSVSDDYVRTLLQTKIVVVTQRDGWEDHFRLFEALAAGTMVLMDEMVSLPHGLEDGESVVFFRSMKEMQEKAMYYFAHREERLAIARKGWEVTMEKHRSWHRLEEMLFGRGLTKPSLNESWHFEN